MLLVKADAIVRNTKYLRWVGAVLLAYVAVQILSAAYYRGILLVEVLEIGPLIVVSILLMITFLTGGNKKTFPFVLAMGIATLVLVYVGLVLLGIVVSLSYTIEMLGVWYVPYVISVRLSIVLELVGIALLAMPGRRVKLQM